MILIARDYPWAREQLQGALGSKTEASELELLMDYPETLEESRIPALSQGLHTAMAGFPKAEHPELWAWLQHQLGRALLASLSLDRSRNIEEAIEAFSAALSIRSREGTPEAWAESVTLRAEAFRTRWKGEPTQNVQMAIESLRIALETREKLGDPNPWAETAHYLGLALSQSEGRREEHLEAVDLLEHVVDLRQEKAHPLELADSLRALAKAHLKLASHAASHAETAIQLFDQSREITPPDRFPLEWARTTSSLAHAFFRRAEGDEMVNTKTSLALYERAVERLSPDEAPLDRAMNRLQSGLVRYLSPAENLDAAVTDFESCLGILNPELHARDWGRATHYLALAYQYRESESPESDIELSIEAHERFLAAPPQEDFDLDLLITSRMCLGGLYLMRKVSDEETNCRRGIELLEELLDLEPKPEIHTQATLLLAQAYRLASWLNPEDRLQSAVQVLERALDLQAPEVSPERWAQLSEALAKALCESEQGENLEKLQRAALIWHQTMGVWNRIGVRERRDLAASSYGSIQERVILLYQQRLEISPSAQLAVGYAQAILESTRGNHETNLTQAAEWCKKIIDAGPQNSSPLHWAKAQRLLGQALIRRNGFENDSIYAQAIQCFNKSLEALKPSDQPVEWAKSMLELANAYHEHGQPAELDKALSIYRQLESTLDENENGSYPPDLLAEVLSDWTTACLKHPDSLAHVEVAIEKGERAKLLLEPRRVSSSLRWAIHQNNLAVAYLTRRAGDMAENVERVITALRLAQEELTESWVPNLWAKIEQDLGEALLLRLRGNRDENIQRAIDCFDNAARTFQQSDEPTAIFSKFKSFGDKAVAHLLLNPESKEGSRQAALALGQAFDLPFKVTPDQLASVSGLIVRIIERAVGFKAGSFLEAEQILLRSLNKVQAERISPTDPQLMMERFAQAFSKHFVNQRLKEYRQHDAPYLRIQRDPEVAPQLIWNAEELRAERESEYK